MELQPGSLTFSCNTMLEKHTEFGAKVFKSLFLGG